MFHVLVASQPVRTGWVSSTMFSSVTHGALIAAALASTGRVPTAVHETRAAVAEPIVYVQPRARPPRIAFRTADESPDPGAEAEKETAPTLPDFSALNDLIDQSLSTPDVASEPDLNPMMMAWLTQPDALSTRGASSTELVMARTALERPPNGVYSSDMVEVSVAPKRGNPLPRYPSALREMGIEGSFVVRFVVDSTGKVPDDKIDFPSSMHRLFADAVRTALHRSRYAPALVGGRPVTELVVQEFRFVMRKR
jgi:TonB family protein